MSAWIDAFLPTFGLIGLGALLRARVLRDGAVWAGIESLTFWVFLPALLASSISTVRLGSLPVPSLAAALWTTLLLATAAGFAIARLRRHDWAAMTSVVQGSIRFNTYMMLAIVAGLYGPQGLAVGGVVAGLIVTAVQTILTLVFVLSRGERVAPARIVGQVISNPLLLACLAGFACAGLGGMPPGLGPLVRSLGQAALALGLLCVGAEFVLASLREAALSQLMTAILKLGLVPAVTLALTRALGLDPLPGAVAVMAMAMPTAPTAYVMARAMGGDARMMGAAITLQHGAAIVTLPAWALLLLA